jgi:hypothetical protein
MTKKFMTGKETGKELFKLFKKWLYKGWWKSIFDHIAKIPSLLHKYDQYIILFIVVFIYFGLFIYGNLKSVLDNIFKFKKYLYISVKIKVWLPVVLSIILLIASLYDKRI